MEYSFHFYNERATDGVTMALDALLTNDLTMKLSARKTSAFQKQFDKNPHPMPVVVCVGSDLAVGDSLGPLVGSLLKHKTQGLGAFIYGTLASPITAKEIKYLRPFLKETHPASLCIAVDAAVGESGDIGLIKALHKPLLPGAGAQKKLGAVGDISVLGIVAEKSVANFGLLNTTRLNLVYSMAQILSDALANLLWNRAVFIHKPLDS
jgi:putative sporulation protein YyaC